MSHDMPLYTLYARELQLLQGTGVHAMALYLAVLKPRADGAGQVQGLTYRKIAALLTTMPSGRGGRRPPPVSVNQVRGWLERLEAVGLLWRDLESALQAGELRIFVIAPR